MKLDRARCLALLLALALAPVGVAQAQQYPYTEASFADVDEDAPPPPPGEDGAGEAAPAAPGAEAAPPAAGLPVGDQPGAMPSAAPQPGDWPNGGPALGCPCDGVPMIQPAYGDDYVGGDMLCAQDYGGQGNCCQTGCCQTGCCNDDCHGCCNDCGGCGGHGLGCRHGLCCGDACVPCYIYFRADVIFMTRTNPRNQTMARTGVGGPVALQTGNLSFRWEPVERFLIGVPVDDNCAIEISYMGLQTWRTQNFAQATVTPAGVFTNLFTAFSNFGANPLTAADNTRGIQMGYNSTLHNSEFNFVHGLRSGVRGRLDLVHGVRWMELREGFNFSTFDLNSALTSNTTVSTFNTLVGYQVGGRLEVNLCPRLHLMFEPKAGLYANWMVQRSTYAFGAAILNETARRNELALAADASLTLSYDLADWCSVRFGYTVMNMTGVALAPENFAALPVPFGAVPRVPVVNVGGSVLFHGASLGLEARF